MKESQSSGSRMPWLDVARLLAMLLVVIQHWLSDCDIRPARIFFKLDSGQIGVAMFFGISGFLGLQGRGANVRQWLTKRLTRIFIPYWIALTGVFIANVIWSYKPVSSVLIVSEYLGLAGWTHRGQIVGVHFWFV